MRLSAAQRGFLLSNAGLIGFGALTVLFLSGAIYIPDGRAERRIMTGWGLFMAGMLGYFAGYTHAWIHMTAQE